MKKEEVYITKNSVETQKLGEEFAKRLPKVIALYGELGLGKTTFVQGLAKGLGIKKIISPTFIIIRTYKINLKSHPFGKLRTNLKTTTQNLKLFYHIDLYRVQLEKDLRGLGIKEIMSDPENIVVIEWAERMGDLLPEKRIDIKFEYINEDKRRITIIKRCHPEFISGPK